MSLLLDALNRAQKNKDSQVLQDEASNDTVMNKNVERISPHLVDMEGLDLSNNNNKTTNTQVKGAQDLNEESSESAPILTKPDNTVALEIASHRHLIGKNNQDENSNSDKKPDDSATENNQPEFSAEQKTDSDHNSFPGLSLEDIPEIPEKKPSAVSELLNQPIEIVPKDVAQQAMAGDIQQKPAQDTTQLTAHTETRNTAKVSASSHSKTERTASINTNPTSNKGKNTKTQLNKKTDTGKIKFQFKTRKTILNTTLAVVVGITAVLSGYYYYIDQLNNLEAIENPYVGRSLTPIGAVPPEVTPSSQTENENLDIISTNSKPLRGPRINNKESSRQNPVTKPKTKNQKVDISKSSLQNTKPTIKTQAPKNTVANKLKKNTTKNLGNVRKTTKTKQDITNIRNPNTHKNRETPIHTLLVAAFNEFQSGNYGDAKKKYSSVISFDKNNRDALLGLGAIAVRQKNLDLARQYYTKILKRNQNDSVARAALVGLVGQLDPVKAESELKLMLKDEPSAGYLHFTLGNIYALQQRWLEAQSAFFNAYRTNNKNPDYAYNVAVSLDHLGEKKSAIKFYKEALTYSKTATVSFQISQVKKRISTLIGSPSTRNNGVIR